jgi:hypothetical protein
MRARLSRDKMKAAVAARALVCAFPCLAMAQFATLEIKIIDGDSALHRAGTRDPRPLTVQVSDENGRPVEGAAVSFRLPEEGPGGLFANGLRTGLGIGDANGRASIRNLQANSSPGAFQIRITAAKDQARAGTLSRQFIDGTARVKPKSGKKWIVVGLVAAGVAGGLGAAVAGGSAAAHPAPAPASPPVSIGSPTISVGRP